MERLGSMTPEDLEALPGIDPETVEGIQAAVNGYYGQFETSQVEAGISGEPAAGEMAAGAAPAAESENESVTIEKTESSA